MSQPCLAELSGAHKRYSKTVALDGLDLRIRRRELLAVLGPNPFPTSPCWLW
jgi:ABC-type multidrug transport system ATPase subunit